MEEARREGEDGMSGWEVQLLVELVTVGCYSGSWGNFWGGSSTLARLVHC